MLATRIVAMTAAAGVCAGLCSASAHAQVRIAEWNVTNYSSNDFASRGAAFQTAFYGIAPNGLQFAPDMLIVQEIDKSSGTGNAVAVASFVTSILNSAPGSPGDWVAATFVVNQGDTSNALFYRSSRFAQVGAPITLGVSGQDVGSGNDQAPRDNQRWRMRIAGYTGAGAEFYVYAGHFKAGDTGTDQTRRIPEAKRIRNDANNLPANAGGFLLGGDFNIQNSSQTAYRYMVEYSAAPLSGYDTPTDVRQTLAGQFWDPINKPGAWNNGCAFRNIHTQEPGASTGGMDDRHDQILISSTLRDGQGLSYLPNTPGGNILLAFKSPVGCTSGGMTNDWDDNNHSYRCWGNDGNHFNLAINAGGYNTQVGTTIAAALITTTQGNGHLPVFLDMQVPAKLGAPIAGSTIDFGTVGQNSTATVTIQISNAANVSLFSKDGSGWGIDGLTYSLAASAGFSVQGGTGPFNRTATALPAQVTAHTLVLNTSATGLKSGTLTITSDDPDEPTRVINLVAQVGDPGPPVGNFDVNADGAVNTEDLYAWFLSPPGADVNGDSVINATDLALLRLALRYHEAEDITDGRR